MKREVLFLILFLTIFLQNVNGLDSCANIGEDKITGCSQNIWTDICCNNNPSGAEQKIAVLCANGKLDFHTCTVEDSVCQQVCGINPIQPEYYTLAITGSGNGKGQVYDYTSNSQAQKILCEIDSGIATGGCSYRSAKGTIISLKEYTYPGSEFYNWTGNVPQECMRDSQGYRPETCSITMDSDKTVKAVFNIYVPSADTTAPVITISSPENNQELAAGTISVSVAIRTDENADCRYNSVNPNFDFESQGVLFTTTREQLHSFAKTTSDGQSYTFYYKCKDNAGNTNLNSVMHSFKIASSEDLYYQDFDGDGWGSGTGVLKQDAEHTLFRNGNDCKDIPPENDDYACRQVVCCQDKTKAGKTDEYIYGYKSGQKGQECNDNLKLRALTSESMCKQKPPTTSKEKFMCSSLTYAECSICIHPNAKKRCGLNADCSLPAGEVWNGLDDGTSCQEDEQCVIGGQIIETKPTSVKDYPSAKEFKACYFYPGGIEHTTLYPELKDSLSQIIKTSNAECFVKSGKWVETSRQESKLEKQGYKLVKNNLYEKAEESSCLPNSEFGIINSRYGEFALNVDNFYKKCGLLAGRINWQTLCVKKDKCIDNVDNDGEENLLDTYNIPHVIFEADFFGKNVKLGNGEFNLRLADVDDKDCKSYCKDDDGDGYCDGTQEAKNAGYQIPKLFPDCDDDLSDDDSQYVRNSPNLDMPRNQRIKSFPIATLDTDGSIFIEEKTLTAADVHPFQIITQGACYYGFDTNCNVNGKDGYDYQGLKSGKKIFDAYMNTGKESFDCRHDESNVDYACYSPATSEGWEMAKTTGYVIGMMGGTMVLTLFVPHLAIPLIAIQGYQAGNMLYEGIHEGNKDKIVEGSFNSVVLIGFTYAGMKISKGEVPEWTSKPIFKFSRQKTGNTFITVEEAGKKIINSENNPVNSLKEQAVCGVSEKQACAVESPVKYEVCKGCILRCIQQKACGGLNVGQVLGIGKTLVYPDKGIAYKIHGFFTDGTTIFAEQLSAGKNVKIRRSSGVIEDGWIIKRFNNNQKTAYVEKISGEVYKEDYSVDKLFKDNPSEIQPRNLNEIVGDAKAFSAEDIALAKEPDILKIEIKYRSAKKVISDVEKVFKKAEPLKKLKEAADANKAGNDLLANQLIEEAIKIARTKYGLTVEYVQEGMVQSGKIYAQLGIPGHASIHNFGASRGNRVFLEEIVKVKITDEGGAYGIGPVPNYRVPDAGRHILELGHELGALFLDRYYYGRENIPYVCEMNRYATHFMDELIGATPKF